MAQFILLLHDAGRWDADMSPDQMQAIIQRYIAWRAKVQQNGRAIEGHKLYDGQGRVMRGSGGALKVTDGPYAESREVIGGLFLIEADSYDEVLELAKDCPHLDFGSIEIRQVQPT
ncbi:MAG TPA: YciI family protein [Vicinamibacterales bacterium]|nr:YciI family protein [Vicinamibacterales bacterium]